MIAPIHEILRFAQGSSCTRMVSAIMCSQVIQKISKLNDDQIAERSYEILAEDVVTDPRIPAEVIQQSIKFAARSDARVKNVDVSRAVDMVIANKIMESGK
jgi:hypothetical protein